MKQGIKFVIGGVILAPLMLAMIAERDAETNYTAVYINVPFAAGSYTVELLPEWISIQRTRHLKVKGILYNRFSASSPMLPEFRRSLNSGLVTSHELEWVPVKASIATVSLILLVALIAMAKNQK